MRIEIQLPESYTHQEVTFMIGDDLMTFTANHSAIVVIRRNKIIQRIQT